MSKTLLKIIFILLAIGLVIAGLVAFALPRLVDSDEFRTSLRVATSKVLGAPVEWQSIEVGLFPARIAIQAPTLATASSNRDDARVTATSVELRLALLPILRMRIEVVSLILHGVELLITRTPEGFLYPIAPIAGESTENASGTSDQGAEGDESAAFDLAIHRFVITKGRVIVRDQTLAPPVEWRLEDLELEARGEIVDSPLAIRLRARVDSNDEEAGRIEIAGMVSLDGLYDLAISVDELLLPALEPYLKDTTMAGGLSGRISIAGASSNPTEIEVDLHVTDLAVKTRGVDVEGQLQLQGKRAFETPANFTANLDLASGGGVEITGQWMTGGEPESVLRLEVAMKSSDGSQLDVAGTSTREGLLDLHATAERFDLGLLKDFLPYPAMELAGFATGSVRLVGAAASPEFVELDVAVESGLLRVPDYLVEGPFDVELRVDSPFSGRPRGRFAVDLTGARLDYRGSFQKRAGMRADLTTKFAPGESGKLEFESRVRFRDIDEIHLQGALGETSSVTITSPSLDLEACRGVLPILERLQARGAVVFDGVELEFGREGPTRFEGRIAFEEVDFVAPYAGRIRVRGAILGEGTRLQSKALRVSVGAVTLALDAEVDDALNSRRFVIAVESLGDGEVNDLFSGLTPLRDMVFGDLRLVGALSGVAQGREDLIASLEGAVEFSIGERRGGRLRGFSLLETVLDQVPLFGGAWRLTRSLRGAKSVDEYSSDDFEIMEGDFSIGEGKVHAKTLRLAYEAYEVILNGPIRLRDLTIDMTGELVLEDDLISALGGISLGDAERREPIRIPLARVTNTLIEPKVEMTTETLTAIPQLLVRGTGLDTISIGVGRALGRVLRGGED